VQPARCAAAHFHLLGLQTDFFPQLAIQGLFRVLALLHPALRKLPAATASPAAEEYAPVRLHQQDAHVTAKTGRVDLIHHGSFVPAPRLSDKAASLVFHMADVMTDPRRNGRAALVFAVLIVSSLGIATFALQAGSAGLSLGQTARALAGGGDSLASSIVWDLRLPRIIAGFGVGALLGLAGVLLQTLLRNPLADPFVLGLSGGGAIGALLAMSLGAGVLATQGAAALGALAALAAVLALGGDGSNARLLLTGAVIASACGAFLTVLLTIADAPQLRGMVFWLAGDLGWAPEPLWSLVLAALATLVCVARGRGLDVLASGDLRAASLGLAVPAWRRAILLGSALLTAVAVVTAGTIGFVGLVVPHAVRLGLGSANHRLVSPAAALAGGALLVFADALARTVAAPRQLPVGAVMALLGAPIFVLLLRRAAR
jgi:iron complex transport system permease protein